jgi:hypothetical protein
MTLAYQRIEDLITEMFGPEADRAKLRIFATVIMAATSLDNKPPRGGCGKENAETSYGYREYCPEWAKNQKPSFIA